MVSRKHSRRSRELLRQRLVGLFILVLCAIIVLVAVFDHAGAEQDASPVLFFGPLGLYLTITRRLWLHL